MSVSIIIPTFNHRRQLERCLKSIRKQTYQDREIIVVDDGSTDDTSAWLKDQTDVRSIRQSHRGAAAARNAGAKLAPGDYLFFCDADVRLRRTAIADMVRVLEAQPNAAFTYPSFIWGWRWFRAQPFDQARLRQHNYISTMALVRTKVFPGFDESLERYQDWDLWLRLVADGHVGVPLPKTLFRVSRHKNEISHQAETQAEALSRIRQKHHLPKVDL